MKNKVINYIKFTLVCFFTFTFVFNSYSQRTCTSYDNYIIQNQNDSIKINRKLIERKIVNYIKENIENRDVQEYRIPVVVHIVMPNPNEISDAQILTQIDVLNEDYNGVNPDAVNIPPVFQNLFSNTRFTFYLANVGPDCNGITRTITTVNRFFDSDNFIKRTSSGGRDPIEPEHILNIWVGNIWHHFSTGDASILGYGQHPGGNLQTDGVAIHPEAFGTNGTALPPYDLGRTATHEIGHYFNLFHIWGDDGGACTGDDQVGDTPNQGDHNFGCPNFPNVSCSNGPNGDMFMNYMDYCDDDCLLMFTNGQSDRMIVTLLNGRHGLLEGYVSDITVELDNTDPLCGIPNGSLIANVRCGEPPYEYHWSNNETTQTIENLSAGTYSVTVTDAVGNTAEATISLEEEIIIPGEQPLWSQAIEHYHLSPTDLYQRNVFIEKELIMDVDYSFWGVNLGFANESQFTIAEGITTNTNSYYSNQTIFKPCEGEWKGISLNSKSKLNLINSEILNANKGISALSNSELNLNNCSIVGENGNIGIEMEGDVRCKVEYTTIDNYFTAVQSNTNSTLPEFTFCKISNVNVGFNCLQSPISVGFSTISPSEISVTLDQCPGSILAFCQFNSGQRGISAINSPAVTLGFIYGENQLKDWITLDRCSYSNVLYGVNLKASEYGLKAFNSFGLEISDLNFEINGIPNTAGGGIQLNDCNDGKILHTKIDANQCTYGIETNNSSGNEISNNTIDLFSSISIRTAAIRNLGSTFGKVDNNLINGLANVTGIIAQNSSANTYSCNEMTNTADGLSIYYNSIFHDIKGNHFLKCATDLKIRSVIGPQYYKGNEFYNGNCLAEGLTVNEIQQSKFLVNQNIPHHMPSNPNPGNGQWFEHQPVNEYFDDCPEDPRGGRTGFDDERILNDYFDRLKLERSVSPERFFLNMMHLLTYDYAREDYLLPRYITEDPIWLQLSDWTELAEAIDSLSYISKMSGHTALNQNDMNSLSMLQKAYAEAEDEATRELIYTQLSELILRLSPAFDQERLIDSIEMDRLKNQFRSLYGRTDQMVSRWADIYSMYIDFLQKGEVDESNKATLLAYSRECADKYGEAIHLARSMANTFDKTYFDVFDDCPEEIRPRAASNTLNAIVQPNPTKGELNIVMENPFTGTIELFDITGKLVYSNRCDNIFEKTILLNLNEGVFMMKITSVDGESDIEKVIVTK